MNVAEWILSRGRDRDVAILVGERAITYEELRSQVGQVARGLLAQAHHGGERVGIWSENSLFFIAAYLGIIRADLVAVPLPTELTDDGLRQIACEAGFRALFVSRHQLKRLGSWVQGAGVTVLLEGDWLEVLSDHSVSLPTTSDPDGLAALMFT